MKTPLPLLCSLLLFSRAFDSAQAQNILQPADGSAVAFKADLGLAGLVNTPNSQLDAWVSIPDPSAAGGTALYCNTSNAPPFANGINGAGGPQFGRPNSFVTYTINFAQPGTYTVYYRWRANPAVVAANSDNSQANSAFFPNTFGAFTNAGDASPFHTAGANGVAAPASTAYQWRAEGTTYSVAAPGPQVFTLGEREWGFFLDRILFSTNAALTPAQLDATPNAFTDAIPQGLNDTYVAFEADRPNGAGVTYLNSGDPTKDFWVSLPDSGANGGSVLYCNTSNAPPFANGINGAGAPQFGRPNSFVTYNLNFSQPGTYTLYYRWRANPSVVAANSDNSQANSAFFPTAFGAFTTAGATSPFYTAKANGVAAPASTVYQWSSEANTYTVTTPGEQVFTLADREWGFMLDRIVFSLNGSLAAAQLDGLADSGGLASPPKIKQVTGSWGNQYVNVTFSDAVNPGTVAATNFTLSGGISVTGATVSAANPALVVLNTSLQGRGSNYTLTVNRVTSAISGLAVPAGSTAAFTAWQQAPGWSLLEVYYASGNSALDITNVAAYSNSIPDATYWVKGAQADHFPDGTTFSGRLTTLWSPTNTDTYSLYGLAKNDAAVFYSPNVSAAELGNYSLLADLNYLASFGTTVTVPPAFGGSGPFPVALDLLAGSTYTLQALLRQTVGDSYLKLTAAPSSFTGDPANLNVLGAPWISAWVNPDLGRINIAQQPTSTSAATHSRATFSVKAVSAAGQSPLYYQWRSNGVDIAGANRATYITPVLDPSYNGAVYSVLISVAGSDTLSTGATLSVVPGAPPGVQPYVGINFSGGDYAVVPGVLTPFDVAGVVRQENWNNIWGASFDGFNAGTGGLLVDAGGNASGVSLLGGGGGTYVTGTKVNGDADGLLLQGYSDGSGGQRTYEIDGLTSGTYNVLVYSVGFSFNATYEEDFDLSTSAGNATFATVNGRAQTGADYNAHPSFVRMLSHDPGNRDSGNYVQFDGVDIAAGDAVYLTVTPQSLTATEIPAVNAIQLVQVLPRLAFQRLSPTNLSLSWPYAAVGFTLESSSALGAAASWSPVAGTPNPITGAGSATVSLPGGSRKFFRLRR